MAPMGKKSYLQVAPFDPDVSRRWFRNTLAHIRLSRTDEDTRGLAPEDDQLLTQDNVFSFSPVTSVGIARRAGA